MATAAVRLRHRQQDDATPLAALDNAALSRWLETVTGRRIPTRTVCPGHNAPFAFVADLFFHRVSEALVLANRGGGKTANTAALHLANANFKPGFETSHIGAIEIQARRCYAYYRRGLMHPLLRRQAPDPHIRETRWGNGSWIEILPGTEAQTQGGQPQRTPALGWGFGCALYTQS